MIKEKAGHLNPNSPKVQTLLLLKQSHDYICKVYPCFDLGSVPKVSPCCKVVISGPS